MKLLELKDFLYILYTMGTIQRAKINKNNERYCIGCGDWYEQIREHWVYRDGNPRGNYCKKCFYERKKPKEITLASFAVPSQPHKYKSEIQKNETQKFLTSIGWKFNEELNHWWKEPYVNQHGEWKLKEGTEKPFEHIPTEDEKQQIIELYSMGAEIEDLSSDFNIKEKTIATILRSSSKGRPLKPDVERDHRGKIVYNDRKIPYRGRMDEDEIKSIIDLYEQEYTIKQIANKIGRSDTAVRYRIDQHNGIKK